ncbi:MAG TPA: helix-turn-helix domain-containing protein, partial [Hyphomicrobiaceae bacterium]|nr:helix-turn-helix domain-containing protein [Hyphomicrobiaceae bacterium]
ALHRIEVRLARFILGICAQQAPAQNTGLLTVDLGMSQGELALLLGGSRPKVNGALMMLEDQGAIERDGNRLQCELDQLRVIAEIE